MQKLIKKEIHQSIDVKRRILDDQIIITQIEEIVDSCLKSLESGGKIIFCGNGGSFADSQHLAAEFVSRLRFNRNPLPSIALGTNSSNMTAIGNDYGYDQVFKREIIALGNKNDTFIPISTSGNSKNVIEAINAAKDINIRVFAFSGGNGGKINKICNTILVPSTSTEKIQEVHIMFGHIVCYLVEKKYFKK